MKIIFISDIHLGANEDQQNKERQEKLIQFLNTIAVHADRLVINGDLFDFWFEYKTVIPRGNLRILAALLNLRDHGVQIDYVAGNHDFWLSNYLTEELGIRIHMDEFILSINGKKIWIYHGDGIAAKDNGYRLMKKIFRFPLNIYLYRWLHPDLGIPLAKWISHGSRRQSYKKNLDDEQDYIRYAEDKFAKGYQYVILGHRHQPFIHTKNENIYINLGDWITHFSYAIYSDNQLKLEYYQ